jgi:hypothetical protein
MPVNQSLGPAAVSMLFRVICMLVSSGSLARVCLNLEGQETADLAPRVRGSVGHSVPVRA